MSWSFITTSHRKCYSNWVICNGFPVLYFRLISVASLVWSKCVISMNLRHKWNSFIAVDSFWKEFFLKHLCGGVPTSISMKNEKYEGISLKGLVWWRAWFSFLFTIYLFYIDGKLFTLLQTFLFSNGPSQMNDWINEKLCIAELQ